MKRIRSFLLRAFPVVLFLLAVVPRAHRPVSRPLVWYLRSAHFIEGVLAGDFANTIYPEHPGVGLTWPVGLALKFYWSISGVVPAAHAVPPGFEPIHFFGPVPLSELTAALFTVALLIALGVVMAYSVLRRFPPAGLDALLLVAYVVFFLIEVSLPKKKLSRYVLPTIPVLNILAAMGLVAWARKLAGHDRRAMMLVMGLPVLIQAVLILPRHPYYGTAFNHIAGGPQAAARAILLGHEAEGFAELAAYLNARPNAERITVAAQPKHVFSQTFRGTTVDIVEDSADYVAFHRNYTVRKYKFEQWGPIWERYAARTPQRRINFDGVPYAWLYPALSADVRPEHMHLARVGERFRYLSHDLPDTEVCPGDRLPAVLYWQATEPITDDLSIFVHLLDPAGQLVWQDDGAASHGDRPTWSWAPGRQWLIRTQWCCRRTYRKVNTC